MKTKLFRYSAVALILVLLGGAAFSIEAHGNHPTVVALGDSLTIGVNSDESYVDILSDWSDVNIINEGVSGDTTQEALDRLQSDVLSRNPDVVLVFLGGNDILQNIPKETTFSNLSLIVERIQNSGAEVILLGLHNRVFRFDYETGYENVADNTSARYVPNVLEDILGDGDLMADAVHPNKEGHRIIADRIWPEFQEALTETRDNPIHVECDANRERIQANSSVTWNAYVWGGEGDYDYEWSGDENLSGNNESVRISYENSGTKDAQVTVTDSSGETENASCQNSVVVTIQDLVGSCSVRTSYHNDDTEMEIRWEAEVSGGTGDYTYRWSGTDNLSGTDDVVEKRYQTEGEKIGTVVVTSGSQSISLRCAGTLDRNGGDNPLEMSCESTTDFDINEFRWDVDLDGGETPYTYDWGGSNDVDADFDEDSVVITYPNAGKKTIHVIGESGDNQTAQVECQTVLTDEIDDNDSNSDCFIATAAFGTEMEPEVETLRQFRDNHLLTNKAGRLFVNTYYKVSPPIADAIRESDKAKSVVRSVLSPLITVAEELQR